MLEDGHYDVFQGKLDHQVHEYLKYSFKNGRIVTETIEKTIAARCFPTVTLKCRAFKMDLLLVVDDRHSYPYSCQKQIKRTLITCSMS